MHTTIEDFRKAGEIAAQVLAYTCSLAKPGASYREVVEQTYQKIEELGGFPAFPPQINLNEVAAHYSLSYEEDIIFNNELLCIDIGVAYNGAIGDNARSVDLSGDHTKIVAAAEQALANAINLLKTGERTLGAIGAAIEEGCTKHGLQPVRNLGGHGLAPYVIHDEPHIPNCDSGSTKELEVGKVYAIEPFSTTGSGRVAERGEPNVFMLKRAKSARMQAGRDALRYVRETHGTFPFSTRDLVKKLGVMKTKLALKELVGNGSFEAFPALVDVDKGLVAQAENTVLITEEGVEVLTPRPWNDY